MWLSAGISFLQEVLILFSVFQALTEHGGKCVVFGGVHVFGAYRTAPDTAETGDAATVVDRSTVAGNGLRGAPAYANATGNTGVACERAKFSAAAAVFIGAISGNRGCRPLAGL